LHEYASEFVQKPISIFISVEILRAISDIKLPPSKLDIGKLTYEYHSDDTNLNDVKAFVINKLNGANSAEDIIPKDVVLYGFGRIVGLIARELMAETGEGNQLRLRAIVIHGEANAEILGKRTNLPKTDSAHGKFMGAVEVDAKKNL
jgi:glyceraldehyde 3-phosphate dehydrogenase